MAYIRTPTTRTARKQHICDRCTYIIAAGERYVDVRHPQVHGQAQRYHMDCWHKQQHQADCEEEYCGFEDDEYREGWDEHKEWL